MGTTKREQLEKLVHDMKAFGDECDAKDGGASSDDLVKINGMAADVKRLVEEIKSTAEAAGTLDVAKAFLGDLAGTPAVDPADRVKAADERRQEIAGIVNPNGMTLGEAFAKSPAYQEFVSQYSGPDGIRNVRGLKSANVNVSSFEAFGSKAPVTGASSTSGGAFVVNDRYGPVTDLIGSRRMTVRDLCTNVPTTSDTFDFVRVTAKTNNAAPVAEATSSADPAISGASPGPYTVAAASGVKPESDMTLEVASVPIETIAHLLPITRRAAADAPQARALVDAFLLEGLREEEEDQILNGNGTSPNLRGILQTVGISTVGSAGTDIDAIVDAIRTIQLDNRYPTAMVVHPNDWYSTGFLLAKDTSGAYLIADPRRSVADPLGLWGLNVVVTPAMTENTVLVGDFRQAIVADRQQATMYVTDSHKDWFGRNLLAILAEERLGLAVLDPDAFCTVTAV